jgi:hypothetical protein
MKTVMTEMGTSVVFNPDLLSQRGSKKRKAPSANAKSHKKQAKKANTGAGNNNSAAPPLGLTDEPPVLTILGSALDDGEDGKLAEAKDDTARARDPALKVRNKVFFDDVISFFNDIASTQKSWVTDVHIPHLLKVRSVVISVALEFCWTRTATLKDSSMKDKEYKTWSSLRAALREIILKTLGDMKQLAGDGSLDMGDEQHDATLTSLTHSTLTSAAGVAGSGGGNTESDIIKSCLGELFRATQTPDTVTNRNKCNSKDAGADAVLASTSVAPAGPAATKPLDVKERRLLLLLKWLFFKLRCFLQMLFDICSSCSVECRAFTCFTVAL